MVKYRPKHILGWVPVTLQQFLTPSVLLFLYLLTHDQASGTPVGGSLLTGIANLAKSEVLNSREWDKLTVDNDHIVAELKEITDIASDFQDGGIVSERSELLLDEYYSYQAGFLCEILERLHIATAELEDFALKLLEFYKVPRREIENVQTAFDSLDQSVKAIMNIQVRDIGWKPQVPQESKSWIGIPGQTGTTGGRSPQDNTLDTSVVMKLQMGNSAIGNSNSAALGNSLIADATPRYSSRGYIEGWGGSRKLKERFNICDLVDGIAYFLKNDIFDYDAIFTWVWGKKNLFGGEVLINTEHPNQIEQTLSVAINDLVKARRRLKEYVGNLVEEIISVPSLHAVKFPERLPRFQKRTEKVLDIVEEFKAASDMWAKVLRRLSVSIERIANDRIRSAFASKVKDGGIKAQAGRDSMVGRPGGVVK
ncbi:hypothetical protein TWF730_005941 [Orbilia blumenaviensis]|uniref:Uncharacterized protein n=1 Tax=Orbilia blumenaviensis TaxID=1796055 RepID=A0AAV9VM64_9PEZI